MKNCRLLGCLLVAFAGTAGAQLTSPLTGLDYEPHGISPVGGAVIELVGDSGFTVIAQIAADELFYGYYNSFTNSFFGIDGAGPEGFIADSILGVRNGYTTEVLEALGGGIASMAIRLSEYDGDTGSAAYGPGVNQFNPLLGDAYSGIDLLVNGLKVADFESVGFESGILETDFFLLSDASVLDPIYASLWSEGTLTLGYLETGGDKGLAFVDFQTGLPEEYLGRSVAPLAIIPEPSVVGWCSLLVPAWLLMRRRR